MVTIVDGHNKRAMATAEGNAVVRTEGLSKPFTIKNKIRRQTLYRQQKMLKNKERKQRRLQREKERQQLGDEVSIIIKYLTRMTIPGLNRLTVKITKFSDQSICKAKFWLTGVLTWSRCQMC